MLPEKKKRLIIGIIATFAIIIIVILLALLSNYIKSRHENQNHERRNDAYPEKYEYFGITMDKDGIYKLYGISGDEEEYLNVRTFYNVEDMIIKNNKLVIYSDAVNELRYDKKTKEFYFYEIDSNYSNKYKVLLSKDYIVTKEDKINLLKSLSNYNSETKDYYFITKLPDSINNVLFPSSTIDNIEITTKDKVEFISKMSTLKKDASVNEIYNIVDTLPNSNQKLVNPKMNV